MIRVYVEQYAINFANRVNNLQPERCERDPPWIKHAGVLPGEGVCV